MNDVPDISNINIPLHIDPNSIIICSISKHNITPKNHYVYLLQSIPRPGKTYIGYTVDPAKRLRKHNGEIKGGAKKTSYNRPWRMICYISGFPDNIIALQYEWNNNHPKMMGLTLRNGVKGKIKTMYEVLLKERFTKNAILTRSLKLQMNWLVDGYSLPGKLSYCDEFFFIE